MNVVNSLNYDVMNNILNKKSNNSLMLIQMQEGREHLRDNVVFLKAIVAPKI